MRFTTAAFLGFALVLLATPAMSQDKPALTKEEKDAWEHLVFEEVLQRSCEDPTLASAIALPQPLLNVEMIDDKTIVLKGRLGTEMGKHFVASVDVKSPFNSSGETTLADQDGLSKGSTLDLKLTWFGWKPREIPQMIQEWKPEETICNDNDKDKSSCAKRLEGNLINFMKEPPTSRPSGIAILGKNGYEELRDQYQRWLRDKQPIIPVLTLNGHGEQKDFNFFVPAAGPPAGLKKTSESHQNYHVTSSAGAYILGNVYASLNYSRGREYMDGAKKDFCTADSLTGELHCQSLTLAPPRSQRMEKLELEVRGLTRSLGFGLHLTRDRQAEFTKVEIPVYLLQKLKASKMELNLGAKLQWRSDTRKYAVSVFLGPTFSSVFRAFSG